MLPVADRTYERRALDEPEQARMRRHGCSAGESLRAPPQKAP